MGPVVNLRTVRKRAKRLKAEQEAAANRLAHGISKKEQNLIKARSDKDQRRFDHHRIERGEGQ
jgi:ribosomal protein S2